MPMSFFHYSHRKAIGLALTVVLLLLLFPSLFRVVFAAKDEVSFRAGPGTSTCGDFYLNTGTSPERCTSTYNISLGNTGTNHQKQVVVELTSVPENRLLSWNALDIVATNRRASGPLVTSEHQGETLRLEIRDLQPNRLVDINIISRGAEFQQQVAEIGISIEAEGTLVETSPRMTVSLRFLRNLSGIFGF